jgi:hypothetical protein
MSSSQRSLSNKYPHRISTSYVLAISFVSSSTRIAASALPSTHKIGAHSPQAATRKCIAFARLLAAEIKSPTTFKNRTGSGMSLTMNLEIVSAESNATYLPSLMAARISKPSVSSLSSGLSRCDSVPITITAFPALRAALIKRVHPNRKSESSEQNCASWQRSTSLLTKRGRLAMR